MVPARLRRKAGGLDALIAEAGEPGVLTLWRRRRGSEQRLTVLRLDEPGALSLRAALNARPRGEPVLLRLPIAQVLERVVNLPLAAEHETSSGIQAPGGIGNRLPVQVPENFTLDRQDWMSPGAWSRQRSCDADQMIHPIEVTLQPARFSVISAMILLMWQVRGRAAARQCA